MPPKDNRSLDNLNDSRTFEQRNDNSIQQAPKASENASFEAKNTLSNEDSDIEVFYEREKKKMLGFNEGINSFIRDFNKLLYTLKTSYPSEISRKYIQDLKVTFVDFIIQLQRNPDSGIPSDKIGEIFQGTQLKELYNDRKVLFSVN